MEECIRELQIESKFNIGMNDVFEVKGGNILKVKMFESEDSLAEITFHKIAADIGLAPKILDTWYCTTGPNGEKSIFILMKTRN